jgi:cell division protein FtsB
MDFSVVSAAMSAITSAKTFGQSLLELRDFSQTAGIVSQLNGELLKAQESLFNLSTQLNQLQQEHHDTERQLRDAQDRLAERGRYELFELSDGVFVYRSSQGNSADGTGEPVHCLCQPCFDKGTKAVLRKNNVPWGTITLQCPICKEAFPTGEYVAAPPI